MSKSFLILPVLLLISQQCFSDAALPGNWNHESKLGQIMNDQAKHMSENLSGLVAAEREAAAGAPEIKITPRNR